KTRLATLQAGDVDMISEGDASVIKTATDAGFSIERVNGSSSTIMLFNLKRPPFNDVRVRRAPAPAPNRHAPNKDVWDDTRTTAGSPFSTDSPYFNKSYDVTEYNPAKARKLLAEYGKPVTLQALCINTPEANQATQVLQADAMKQLGIKVNYSLM